MQTEVYKTNREQIRQRELHTAMHNYAEIHEVLPPTNGINAANGLWRAD